MTVEGAAAVIVTTVDTRTIATHESIATVPVDIRLIDVARIPLIQAVGTTKDGFRTEGRTSRYVDHSASGDTLLIATSIDSLEMTTQQVDDGRCLVRCLWVVGSSLCYAHTYAAALTGTEYLGILIGLHGLRNINQDITAVLHQVLLFFTEVTLSCSVYLLYGIQRVVSVVRTEVDESIVQERLVVACQCVTVGIEVCTEVLVLVVIHTICTTEYLLHAPLYIFYICRSVEHIGMMHLAANGIVTQTAVEIGSSKNLSAQVVTAIYEVTNVWEAVDADISLCMSEDIGITSSCEGVEDTTVI